MLTGLMKNPEGTIYAPGIKAADIALTRSAARGVANGTISSEELTELKGMRQEAVGLVTESKGDDGILDKQERELVWNEASQIRDAIREFKLT